MRHNTPVLHQHASLSIDALLRPGEAVLIVDDDQMIREPLRIYLQDQGLTVFEAGTAGELHRYLADRSIALVLLDIGLPDADGLELLPQLVETYPDLAVVMLTGVSDLQVAMECIRNGAEDYLAKPVRLEEILFVVRRVLERRRLIFENYQYQADLEQARFRMQIFHQLSLKMNTAYLSTVELDEILQAILVGITAEEGLRFNRAFLALFNDQGTLLEGRLAIGAECREEASKVWNEMREQQLGFMDIVRNLKESCSAGDAGVNQLIRRLKLPKTAEDHLLIQAALERRSILVSNGSADVPVPGELIELLGEDSFVVVPLFSPSRSLGVIIADHFVTRKPITPEMVSALELFASQASLAIEHSRLYQNMEKKIDELKTLTQELEKNKDLLVAAERYSALGQMAAQLVHAIRNPITSIGGVARLLAKRVTGEKWRKYIELLVRESDRVEATLDELFNFVRHSDLQKAPVSFNELVLKTVLLLQPAMEKQHITSVFDLPEPGLVLELDGARIRQSILQLVKNSIEAMPDGGQLTVAVQQEKGWVQLSIIDSGTGFPAGYLEKATDPFFTTKTYGTGLGLTMVERAVQDHGGTFALHSREGAGTEALIRLPVQTAEGRGQKSEDGRQRTEDR